MDSEPFNELDPTKVPKPPDELDEILARADGQPALPAILVDTVKWESELEGKDDVKELMPIIRSMLEAEAAAKGKRVYPTRMLRQQHIIAYLLENPFSTTVETCRFFGISPTTLYTLARSDTFKALASRYHATLDCNPDIQQQLKDTLALSIQITQKALVERQDGDFAVVVMDKAANRLGLGAKQGTQVNIQNNVVTPDMIAMAKERRRAIGGD